MQEVPGDWEQQDTVSLQQSLPRDNSSQTGGGAASSASQKKASLPKGGEWNGSASKLRGPTRKLG